MHPLILEVARWEFARHFKLRRELGSMLAVIAMMAGGFWIGRAVVNSVRASPVNLVVTGGPEVPMSPGPDSRLRIGARDGEDPSALREAVGRGELDGVLDLRDPDAPSLYVRADPAWRDELTTLLTQARVEARMRDAGMTQDTLARLLAPVAPALEYHPAARGSTRADRIAAAIAIALMLMGIWAGQAYLFLAITGERTLRVTEQIVAAIPPQAWMDGKILGLSAVALANLAGYTAVTLLTLPISRAAGLDLPWPDAARPALLGLFVLFAVLGFLFWNCVIAAVAAIIDDPNTSNRGAFLLLPLIPVVLALFAINAPDAPLIRGLSLFPVTASPMMAARLAVSDVPAWEVAVSLALLLAAVWFVRIAAGRIFRAGILLYGKEPRWRDVGRWAW